MSQTWTTTKHLPPLQAALQHLMLLSFHTTLLMAVSSGSEVVIPMTLTTALDKHLPVSSYSTTSFLIYSATLSLTSCTPRLFSREQHILPFPLNLSTLSFPLPDF
ncbi:hypothetical protein BJY52DRAFT_1307553 [Lactarius psammicola]|nr:hypothetical protein BJY52DRAFT_1307553 [Lactarius psammicola]